MTSLDDLRATLDLHADDLTDSGTSVRTASVHGRVRDARRRRCAAATGGAAAMLAVVGGIALLPNGTNSSPSPTPSLTPSTTVLGVDVPATMNALGYTYELDDTVTGADGSAVLDLERSNEPRLMSWATSGNDQEVTVRGLTDTTLHPSDADFDNWLYVPPGSADRVSVSVGSGEPAIALYSLGVQRPDGYTRGGVTFRQDVAGGELVAAVVGDPGEARLVLPVKVPGQEMWVQVECAGAPAGAGYDVARDGEPFLSEGRCGDRLPVDLSGLQGYGSEVMPGDSFALEVTVTDSSGALVDAPNLRVALGVYSEDATEEPFAQVVEALGHTWRLIDVQDSAGAAQLTASTPSGSGLVYTAFATRGVDATVALGALGRRRYTLSRDSGTSTLLDPGQRLRFQVRGNAKPQGSMVVGFYARSD